MLTDTITLVDSEAGNQNYDLTFRSGYDSKRMHTVLDSSLNAKLEIKSTIDPNPNSAKPNRHLISLTRNVEDAATGEFQPYTVHAVITRHKDVSDSYVTDLCCQLASLLNDDTQTAKILKGEN